MKKSLPLVALLLVTTYLQAQVEPLAGKWNPWFMQSSQAYRLPPPASPKLEMAQVLAAQQALDQDARQQIYYWSAGAPGYRWQEMIAKLWMHDTTYNGALANLLLGVATHDATLAAWDSKYAYNRLRPFAADGRVKAYAPKPESPSYPCEHSVAAGVAVTILSHFYPSLADSVNHMARRAMASRVAAGIAFPSDTQAGFELGKRIAQLEIVHAKDFVPTTIWNGKRPEAPGLWTGKKPMFPLAGQSKTVVLRSGSQFRPGPPPDYAQDMAELKSFKQTFRSQANAFFFASQDYWGDVLHKKIFEYNLHLNPPRAARVYATTSIAAYDGFIACWDAKYAYWGIRPSQYDTTFHPLLPTPPFPGYPSGHALMSGMFADVYAYFFPGEKASFQKRAKEAAESRFQGGIHFRTDNETGLELGRKVAAAVIAKVKMDGADEETAGGKGKKMAKAK